MLSREQRLWRGTSLSLWLIPLFCGCFLHAQDHTLTILNLGVEASEDAPSVSPAYQFLPGDFVYCTFQIAGFSFAQNAESEARSISLSYEALMEDAKGLPLVSPQSGEVKVPLHPEDKNWIPKRRAAFSIPPFVAAGTYRVRVVARDLLSQKSASAEVSFHIGGPRVEAADGIDVQHFSFLRQDDGGEPLALPAYRPEDTVFIRFDVTNFSLEAGNHYHVGYGVTVFGPDGKVFLSQPNAAQLEDASFYPAQFLPCRIDVLTKRTSLRGAYIVELTVTDFVSKKTRQTRQTFTLE